jgi:hypothetical protein
MSFIDEISRSRYRGAGHAVESVRRNLSGAAAPGLASAGEARAGKGRCSFAQGAARAQIRGSLLSNAGTKRWNPSTATASREAKVWGSGFWSPGGRLCRQPSGRRAPGPRGRLRRSRQSLHRPCCGRAAQCYDENARALLAASKKGARVMGSGDGLEIRNSLEAP